MTEDEYFKYQTKFSNAATVEDLDAIGNEIREKHARSPYFESLMDSYIHVRLVMLKEDGVEDEEVVE